MLKYDLYQHFKLLKNIIKNRILNFFRLDVSVNTKAYKNLSIKSCLL